MNELISIKEYKGQKVVNARELHGFLGIKTEFKEWIQTMLEYDFVENQDYAIKLNSDIFLDFIAKLSYEVYCMDYVRRLQKLLNLYNGDKYYLKDAVFTHLCNVKSSFIQNEFKLHDRFKKDLKNLIPNAELVEIKNHRLHIPDFWIKIECDFIPVEIKLKEINKKSLKQIKRYMDFYKSKQGFVVAPKLSCELPDNVFFIKLEDW
jgi:hypothetical protein